MSCLRTPLQTDGTHGPVLSTVHTARDAGHGCVLHARSRSGSIRPASAHRASGTAAPLAASTHALERCWLPVPHGCEHTPQGPVDILYVAQGSVPHACKHSALAPLHVCAHCSDDDCRRAGRHGHVTAVACCAT